LPVLGKLPKEIFDRIIYPMTGKKRSEVVVPPKHGVDVGVISLGEKVLIVKTDPVFVVPEYGWERSAWFAFHILASDVSTSGNPPMYLSIDLNLPQNMKRSEFESFWKALHSEAEKNNVMIVSGHTGVYGGVDYPMIGGATMFSIADRNHYVTTEMARPGDLVIMTKGPAIETAGILSVMFPEVLERHGGEELRRAGEALFYKQTVVEDALTLASLGLRTVVTSMHDATEYGVWGALVDLSTASNVKIRVYRNRLFIDDSVERILEVFEEESGVQIDPFSSISEGTLIATVNRDYGEMAVNSLEKKGIRSEIIGVVLERGHGVYLNDNGSDKKIGLPERDPFWHVFFKMLGKKEKIT